MEGLENAIDRLAELDRLRVESGRLRDEGKKALRKRPELQWYRPQHWRAKHGSVDTDPESSFPFEDAAAVQALLCHRRPDSGAGDPVMEEHVARLETVAPSAIFDTENDSLPVLRAAGVMSALVAAPDSAFSRTVMLCFYAIIRELHSAEAPDWLIGGARAGEGLSPCAFVTNECIRAVLGFSKAVRHTANYIGGIAEMFENRKPSADMDLAPKEWRHIDDTRVALNFLVTTEIQKENIALKLASINDDPIGKFLGNVLNDLLSQLENCSDEFDKALGCVDEIRLKERSHCRPRDGASDEEKHEAHEAQKNFMRTETAHQIARKAVDEALEKTREAAKMLREKEPPEVILRKLEQHFHRAARDTKLILQPATEYVSRALDRELAAAASGEAPWDVAEMLFAAVAFGYVSEPERWDDDRLRRAGIFASKVVSERGRFPTGRPVHVTGRGYALHALNFDVIRAYAQLVRYAHAIPLDLEVVRRLMHFLQDTQLRGDDWRGTWASDDNLRPDRPKRWVTSSAILALDRVNLMLDERINEEILKNFSVRRPDPRQRLSSLFYADYGLASVGCPEEIRRPQSVAMILERMRAHVRGVRLPSIEPLHSLILYGPPGTGKTTFVETLASSADVLLVQITPSDLMVGGLDELERRARAVFFALSLLTRVVILFDEFDPVLLQRQEDEKNPNAFSFITPGMLPKLTALYGAAERRSVAYVLITNKIGKLDDAAIRGGRFDVMLGIYPPDLLSRAGRLQWVVSRYCSGADNPKRPDDFAQRFENAVARSGGVSMNTLGPPGFFSVPDGLSKKSNIFNYLFDYVPTLPALDSGAGPRFTTEKEIAIRELEESVYVDLWDATMHTQTHLHPEGVMTPTPTVTLKQALTAQPDIHLVRRRVKELRERRPAELTGADHRPSAPPRLTVHARDDEP